MSSYQISSLAQTVLAILDSDPHTQRLLQIIDFPDTEEGILILKRKKIALLIMLF